MATPRKGAGRTRDRILVEASILFAERGYHGTSTRDIASAIGIQQPSLYKHVRTKHEILAALLDADLVPAIVRIRAALAADAPPAVRLHAYLRGDLAGVLRLPYDTRGIYNDDVIGIPELAPQAGRRRELHQLTVRLLNEGAESGELQVTDPDFVQGAITGLMLEMVRQRGAEPAPDSDADERALAVADFVLRATLTDPASLDEVRAASAALVGDL